MDAVSLLQMAMFASVLAATLLQFMGALQVRTYANRLVVRETMQEALADVQVGDMIVVRRLPVILEENEEETLVDLEERYADRKEALPPYEER